MTRKPTAEPDEPEASTTLAIIVDGQPLGAADMVVFGSSWTASFRSPNGRHVVVTSSATLPHELQLVSYPGTTVVPRGPSPLERRAATRTAAYREVRTRDSPQAAVGRSAESGELIERASADRASRGRCGCLRAPTERSAGAVGDGPRRGAKRLR